MPKVKWEHEGVGLQLQQAAERLGLSQTQLSKLSGVSRRQIGIAFKGANISLTILKKLAKILQLTTVSVGELTIEAEQAAIPSKTMQHARTLMQRVVNDATDAVALLGRDDRIEKAMDALHQAAADMKQQKATRTRKGRAA